MTQQDYINEYFSKNHQIKEGYAYAINSIWYRDFERFLQNMSGVDVTRFSRIENSYLLGEFPEQQIHLDQYSLFSKYTVNIQYQSKLRSTAKHIQDFYVVSIDVWEFLKKYHGADFDIVVFITKLHPDIKNYYTNDNLEDGLCINMEFINVTFIIVSPQQSETLIAIKTPLTKWMDITKLRAYIMSRYYFGDDAIRVTNEANLYFQNKKVPFKGNRLLDAVGISQDMQIIMACQNLTLQDIEEEIETDGEEQQIEQNIHTKYEFMQLLDNALYNQGQIDLNIKTINEIQKALEQYDFFQI